MFVQFIVGFWYALLVKKVRLLNFRRILVEHDDKVADFLV